MKINVNVKLKVKYEVYCRRLLYIISFKLPSGIFKHRIKESIISDFRLKDKDEFVDYLCHYSRVENIQIEVKKIVKKYLADNHLNSKVNDRYSKVIDEINTLNKNGINIEFEID